MTILRALCKTNSIKGKTISCRLGEDICNLNSWQQNSIQNIKRSPTSKSNNNSKDEEVRRMGKGYE